MGTHVRSSIYISYTPPLGECGGCPFLGGESLVIDSLFIVAPIMYEGFAWSDPEGSGGPDLPSLKTYNFLYVSLELLARTPIENQLALCEIR